MTLLERAKRMAEAAGGGWLPPQDVGALTG